MQTNQENSNKKTGLDKSLPISVLFKTYFTDLYKEKGKQAVIHELVDYLNNWELEQGGSENVCYLDDNGKEETREIFIEKRIQEIQDGVIQEINELMERKETECITPVLTPSVTPSTSSKAIPVQETNELLTNLEQSEKDTFEYALSSIFGINENQNFSSADYHEVMFINYYNEYREILKQQAKLNKRREDVLSKFTFSVNEWSHYKFAKPTNNQSSIQCYLGAKHNQLKAILPHHTRYRTLCQKIKKSDIWSKNQATIEDDLSQGRGICNENDEDIYKILDGTTDFEIDLLQ